MQATMAARMGRGTAALSGKVAAASVALPGFLGLRANSMAPLLAPPALNPATARDASLDPDLQLVERCLSGEQAAWEDLVKIHTRRVYGICYRFAGSSQHAEDLTQEVFLRVFRSLKSFRAGEGTFTVWLGRLTRNLLIDHYRKSRMDRATDSLDERLPALEETVAMSARTDGMLAGREASEALQAALQKLSPELREILILRDLEELEYREIAGILDIPEGTVKSRLNRARAELARVLRRHKVAV
jgi:RNA polymerase sigma-70 factor (ECF subfamily)